MTDLHAIRSHTFERHLYAFSFNPNQTAITWRTPTRLPSVWWFRVSDRSSVYQPKSLVCETCPLTAQCCTIVSQLHRDFWLTLYTKPGYNNTFHLWRLATEQRHKSKIELRFKYMVFRIEHLCDKTPMEMRLRHVCEDNI